MQIVRASSKLMEPISRVKHVELCGRLCYKSEHRITDESAPKFVKGLIRAKHLAMVEHATYALHVPKKDLVIGRFLHGSFLLVDECLNGTSYIVSGNVRAWRNFFKQVTNFYEYDGFRKGLYWTDPNAFDVFFGDLFPDYVQDAFDIPMREDSSIFPASEDTIMYDLDLPVEVQAKHIYRTFLLTCDRGVTHELVRHRPASFAQESTRYCNYSGKMSFVSPAFWEEDGTEKFASAHRKKQDCLDTWYTAMAQAETMYNTLIELGAKPEEARTVLPNSLKAEIIMTANIEEWDHIIEIRTAPSAHPQIVELMKLTEEQLANSI